MSCALMGENRMNKYVNQAWYVLGVSFDKICTVQCVILKFPLFIDRAGPCHRHAWLWIPGSDKPALLTDSRKDTHSCYGHLQAVPARDTELSLLHYVHQHNQDSTADAQRRQAQQVSHEGCINEPFLC